MKRIQNSLLAGLYSVIIFSSYAQGELDVNTYELDPSVKLKKHHAKITLTNGQKVKGVITSIEDYSIRLENVVYKRSPKALSGSDGIIINNEVHYSNIRKIKIRNIGASIGGFVVGTAVGSVVGGLVGLLSPCEDCEPEERLGKSAFFGALGGVIIGPYAAFDGPFIVNLEIAGEYGHYQNFKNEMERRNMKRMK